MSVGGVDRKSVTITIQKIKKIVTILSWQPAIRCITATYYGKVRMKETDTLFKR